MQGTIKFISWFFLTVTGLVVVLAAFIFSSNGVGIASIIFVVATMVGWYHVLSWVFGLRRKVRKHLGMQLNDATYLEKDIGESRTADVRRSLEQLFNDEKAACYRFGMPMAFGFKFGGLHATNFQIAPLQWTTFESEEGEYENYPTNAVYLLNWYDKPFAIALHGDDNAIPHGLDEDAITTGRGTEKIRLFARNMDEGRQIINWLLQVAAKHSVYRGRMLRVSADVRTGRQKIRILARPNANSEDVVLPPQIMKVLRRTMSARLRHQGLLQRHGHSAKTGIMLHGPPGTGKTLVCKHLIGDCEDFTAIVPTGTATETIREAFRLAVYLQPAIIVLEDVDLLTERRTTSSSVTGLQELMNEMDGLVDTTEAIVLMTTNRPEVIEPALASRPGRVSQAIHFPLPDSALRHQLLTLFSTQADVSQVAFESWVQRTEGASPAFLRELVSRAIVFAAERETSASGEGTVDLTDVDFDNAIHELVVVGGTLTANVVGFPTTPNSE